MRQHGIDSALSATLWLLLILSPSTLQLMTMSLMRDEDN